MKKYLILLALLAPIIQLTCGAANVTRQYSLEYDETEFTYRVADGMLYIGSNVHEISFDGDTLAPRLPLVSVSILIGPDETFQSFTSTDSKTAVGGNVLLAPNPVSLPTNVSPAMLRPILSVIYPGTTYPAGGQVEYTGTHTMDGYKFVTFVISPFSYNAVTQTLYLSTSLNINMVLSKPQLAPGIGSPTPGGVGHNMRAAVEEMVFNHTALDSLYEPSTSPQPANLKWEYMVVTCDSLKAAFEPLVRWKTIKGVKAGILTTEHIDSTYSGSTRQLRIKAAIKDHYSGTYSGLKYVLLGGDTEVVPAQMCYVNVTYRDSLGQIRKDYKDTTPCDLFYGCLDVMDWDTNSNDTVADINDAIDMLPEVIMTRLPVLNTSQTHSCVTRLLNYEISPDVITWRNNMLMGGKIVGTFFRDISQCDAHYIGDSLLYVNYIEPYWHGDKKKLYSTGTDFEGGADYDFSVHNLLEQISNGYRFIYIYTHGDTCSWALENGAAFMDTDAMNAVSKVPTMIVTDACLTNAFDRTCLAEAFMRNDDARIIGYLGCSRDGWYTPCDNHLKCVLGTSNTYSGNFFKNLFTIPSKGFGEAMTLAKRGLVGFCDDYTEHRWVQFGLNALGDPELPIYTDVPQVMSNVTVSKTGNSLVVTNDVDSCSICVAGMNGSYWNVMRNVSNATFNNVPDDCYVCVSKPGYVPYIEAYGDTIYIQDEVLGTHCKILANKVYIGKNVTSGKPEGPVSVDAGNVSINATDGVHIKNDFTVKKGATLKITTK